MAREHSYGDSYSRLILLRLLALDLVIKKVETGGIVH